MNGVIVIGAGGHAKVVIGALRASGRTDVAGIVDDDLSKKGVELLGVPVLGSMRLLEHGGFDAAVIAIGGNAVRRKVAERFNLKWLTVIHPNAWVDPSVKIGEGTLVFAGAVIQPDTTIGRHVIVNTGATIDHDCMLGDFVHVAPGAHLAGGVQVGADSFLGIGSVVIPSRKIGNSVTVAAGGVVIRDLPDHSVAIGVPAKVRGA